MSRDRDPKITNDNRLNLARSYPLSTIVLPPGNSFPLMRKIFFNLKKIISILKNSSLSILYI